MSTEDFLEKYERKRECYFIYPLDNNHDGKLEERKEMSKKFSGIYSFYAVRFYNESDGRRVIGIGDGGRNTFFIDEKKWNDFVELIETANGKELNAVIGSLNLIGGEIFEEGRLERLIYGIKNKEIGRI